MSRRWVAAAALTLLLALQAMADEKHPRVAELEDKLVRDASSFIQGRFPDLPFLVTAHIEPLRRSEQGQGAGSSERLPFLDLDKEEIQDEWDDPQTSVHALLSRIRKAVVTVSVPDTLPDSELSELTDALFASIHLRQARDEIQIKRRSWRQAQVSPWILAVGAGTVLLLLAGVVFSGRSNARRIATALESGSKPQPSPTTERLSPSPLRAVAEPAVSKADVKFSDPIRIRELVVRRVEALSSDPAFPSHEDFFELDRLGAATPRQLGAILMELPAAARDLLFSYSIASYWLDAMNDPGAIEFSSIETLEKLARNHRDPERSEFSKAVLSVWRLGEKRSEFLRMLGPNDSIALLREMPLTVALPAARSAFPGSWATLIDSGFVPQTLSRAGAAQIRAQATSLVPLRDPSLLDQYRNEQEVIEYLRSADVAEERDLYLTLPAGSPVVAARPPFFKVLEQPEEILSRLVPAFGIDDWALSLFNVPKPQRSSIEGLLSEKQRFLFRERLRQLDSGSLDSRECGAARERIAKALLLLTAKPPADQADEASTEDESTTHEEAA